ncbi:hypothetical protein CEXT_615661 [Caerostris extrusa]|uniref:Maturase K n=1 Tax=Caerostris extrusa TaxID=172846 RepID=A0AAV4S922_CAEEX|nr:hypothetical protein CEXT_615661 [Caerostris extrusa]
MKPNISQKKTKLQVWFSNYSCNLSIPGPLLATVLSRIVKSPLPINIFNLEWIVMEYEIEEFKFRSAHSLLRRYLFQDLICQLGIRKVRGVGWRN